MSMIFSKQIKYYKNKPQATKKHNNLWYIYETAVDVVKRFPDSKIYIQHTHTHTHTTYFFLAL